MSLPADRAAPALSRGTPPPSGPAGVTSGVSHAGKSVTAARFQTAADLFQSDRIHPTAAAHPVLLNNVWPALKRLLP